jgi:PRTRC genetic system protein E
MNATVPTGGLFSQLAPLLSHRAVLITVSKLDGDVVQVNFCPGQVKDSENQALTTPLCVTGTAEELDHDLVPQIIGSFARVLISRAGDGEAELRAKLQRQ